MKRAFVVGILLAARAAFACPCTEGGFTFNDEEAALCKSQLDSIAGMREVQRRHPEMGSELVDRQVAMLVSCIKNIRAQYELASQRAEQERQAVVEGERRREAQRAAEMERASALADAHARESEAKQRQEDEDDRLASDPKVMGPALSAAICKNARVRRAAADEIAKERRYARQGGGIVNQRKLYALQQKQREVDENSAVLRDALRERKLKAMACTTPSVRSALACLSFDDGCTKAFARSAYLVGDLPSPWSEDDD